MMLDVVGASTNEGHIKETANVADPVVDQLAKLKKKNEKKNNLVITSYNQPRIRNKTSL